MENAFDCLCHLVAVVEGKEIFLEAEGIELMVIIMK